jgi:2-oxoglutarate dehydrogenase E2 component (dihydrolipoamide succinyltransferase)
VVTDKVDTEITAVDGGTLLKIMVAEGETVKVGTVLAMIGAAGEAVDVSISTTAPVPSEPAVPAVVGPSAAAEPPKESQPVRASPVAARVAAEQGVDLDQVEGTGPGGQIRREDVERAAASAGAGPSVAPAPTLADIGFISPRVARLAALHGVNLRHVTGTGADGRVTARDVEQFVAAGGTAAPDVAGGGPAAAVGAPPGAPAKPLAAAPSGIKPGELVKLSPMRAAIAEHMVRSKLTSPHVTTVHEVDMAATLHAYSALKASYLEKGVRLTLTAFLVKAMADALPNHPMVNSTWTDAGVQTLPDVHVGIAVAVPQGLIVPVIRNADEKSLRGIAREVTDLADRARSRKLTPDEVQGGSITLTNYGTLGSLFGTPIINQPQAAILGAGAIKKRPVVIEGPDGDSIGIRPMMLLALTFDHRILEGGSADPFMQEVVRRLEAVSAED